MTGTQGTLGKQTGDDMKMSFEVHTDRIRTFYRKDKAIAYATSIGVTHIWENGMDESGHHFSASLDI